MNQESKKMLHILVIEDDAYFLELMEMMLVREGHQVSRVGDGVAALLWLAANRADLIITDLMMPNMDGLTLIQELKKQDIATPVIVMSGGQRSNPEELSHASAQRLGFKASLKKPFTRVALRQAVEFATVQSLHPRVPPLAPIGLQTCE